MRVVRYIREDIKNISGIELCFFDISDICMEIVKKIILEFVFIDMINYMFKWLVRCFEYYLEIIRIWM